MDLGNLLTVWAHPDDETYLAGGLMAAAVAAGARVTCVVATAGELGGPPDQQAELARRRVEELAEAMTVLGVTDHAVLHLPDGRCAAIDPAGPVATIAELLDDRRPDTVVAFGPDGVTGHADHRAVSSWVGAALAGQGGRRPRLLHPAVTPDMAAAEADIASRYSIYEPGLPVTVDEADLAVRLRLDDGLLDMKVRALRAHATQTAVLEAAVGPGRYRSWVATECFVEFESL